MRKPKYLRPMPERGTSAGIEKTIYGHIVFIGGDYYGDHAQIHLFADEAERLGKWLLKAAEYFKAKRSCGEQADSEKA